MADNLSIITNTAAAESLAHNWAFAVFLFIITILCCAMLGVSYFLGGRNQGRSKNDPFESGIVGVGGARLRFSSKFYLVAMMFVIFDAEALFIYAWAVCVKEVGWWAFAEISVFISVLLAGLIYLWRAGGLDWAPETRRKRKIQEAEHSH